MRKENLCAVYLEKIQCKPVVDGCILDTPIDALSRGMAFDHVVPIVLPPAQFKSVIVGSAQSVPMFSPMGGLTLDT